jgi:hypothetical protein
VKYFARAFTCSFVFQSENKRERNKEDVTRVSTSRIQLQKKEAVKIRRIFFSLAFCIFSHAVGWNDDEMSANKNAEIHGGCKLVITHSAPARQDAD